MNTMTYESSAAARHRAFTLLELIISMAIIAILLTLVIAPLHRIQNSAKRTDSLGALRQMALAYASYSTDHRQRLMPGYVNETLLEQLDITAELPAGTSLRDPMYCDGNICDASAYVWRLAPYLGNAWETMFVDYHSKRLRSQLETEFQNGVYGPVSRDASATPPELGISRIPSFGMNSIFVGGDSFHGGSEVTPFNPWNTVDNKPIAATRLSEVRNPATLIVFGAAALADTGGGGETYDSEERLGYVELRPPFTVFDEGDPGDPSDDLWTNRQWEIGKNGEVIRTMSGDYAEASGLPLARWGANNLPIAHLDGSTAVEVLHPTLKFDMRRWSPFAVGLEPPPIDLP